MRTNTDIFKELYFIVGLANLIRKIDLKTTQLTNGPAGFVNYSTQLVSWHYISCQFHDETVQMSKISKCSELGEDSVKAFLLETERKV